MTLTQSIPICLALSAIGGILEVFATALLAYPEAQEKEGRKWSLSWMRCALAGNVTLQILASVAGNLFAPWYGPVSIVGPTFLSAQLLANMIIYGSLLGLENFTKDMKVGTHVIVIGAILLPIVGPTTQDDQDIMGLIMHIYSIIWGALLLIGMFVSGIMLLAFDITKFSELYRIIILLVTRVTAFTSNLTVSKMLVLGLTLEWLIVAIILKILSGAIMTYAITVQSTAVTQATFVPLNATMNMLVNALTGIIIWEDWRVVQSWLGYVCVFFLLVIGNYLLLSEVDLFTPNNSRYGRRLTLQRMVGSRNILQEFPDSTRTLQPSEEEDVLSDNLAIRLLESETNGEEEKEDATSPQSFQTTEEDTFIEKVKPRITGSGDDDKEKQDESLAHRSNMPSLVDITSVQDGPERIEVWREVYGIDETFVSNRGKSRVNIFVKNE